MNRLFSTFFDTPTAASGARARRWIPPMDLIETLDDFVLKADLPGVDENDVSIEVERNVLTIAGERKADNETRTEGYHRIERAGSFSRSLTLPEGIDGEAVTASFTNGVLEVHIPKPAQAKPRRVQIGAGAIDSQTVEA